MYLEWRCCEMINAKPTLKSTLYAALYLAPFLIILGVFTCWPYLDGFLMSFYRDYNFYTNHIGGFGLQNFAELWQDPEFHLALKNTLIFVLAVVPLSVGLSLGIAMLLNQICHLSRFFQTIYFLPFVTSTAATALVWNWIFQANDGLLNHVLSPFGIQPIDWLNDPKYSMVALIIMCVWQGLGFNIILFLAALNHIDDHYYQVAMLDGASNWQIFYTVTWPLIKPITVLITISSLIGNAKMFDQIFALFHGSAGPANADLTLSYYLYEKFYEENQYPLACASGIVLFAIIGLLALFSMWYFKHSTGGRNV